MSGQVGIRVEVVFVDLVRVVFEQTFTDQDHLVHTIAAPGAIIIRLQPVHPHDRIVAVGGVTQVVLHVRFIEGQFAAPYQRIWQGFLVDLGVVSGENPIQPVEVFQPIEIGHFHFIHIEGRNGDGARDHVPFVAQVVRDTAHGELTTLHEDQAWTVLLFDEFGLLEAAVLGVVVVPASGAALLELAPAEDGGTHRDQRDVPELVHVL